MAGFQHLLAIRPECAKSSYLLRTRKGRHVRGMSTYPPGPQELALPPRGVRGVFRPQESVRVAVLIESSRSYGRGLLLGVAQYAQARTNWRIDYQERELQSDIPKWLQHWEGGGILARIEDAAMEKRLLGLGVPVVDLRRLSRGNTIPAVHSHEPAVARLVVQHLRERGFEHFGFCGFPGVDYSDTRARLLTKELEREGYHCNVYQPPTAAAHVWTVDFEQAGMESESHLTEWLRGLPKPVGIMACNDVRGQQVINACRRGGIAVPEQAAVIGVDNDEVVCGLSDPPLTSVAPDTRRIGYQAAALLDRLMHGQKLRRNDFYVAPLGIVTRRSTDTLVIPHAGAMQALSFLRRHYQEPITLKNVAAELPVTLRSIQDIFKAHVGRSLHGELHRLRVRRAQELMLDFSHKLESIAAACGFSSSSHFRRTFLRETGKTPQEYRRALKSSSR